MAPPDPLAAELIRIALGTPWFSRALAAVAALGLESWCIGAGAVRNLVWDHQHGFDQPTALADIDVAFFDAADLSAEYEYALQDRLATSHPGFPWEVTNQARVHLWYEAYFGAPVMPLRSIEAAIATWPETATSVALTLDAQGTPQVIAPCGLADLFDMIIRRNPTRVSVAEYERRIETKRYRDRWPRVRIVR